MNFPQEVSTPIIAGPIKPCRGVECQVCFLRAEDNVTVIVLLCASPHLTVWPWAYTLRALTEVLVLLRRLKAVECKYKWKVWNAKCKCPFSGFLCEPEDKTLFQQGAHIGIFSMVRTWPQSGSQPDLGCIKTRFICYLASHLPNASLPPADTITLKRTRTLRMISI